jgi:hypothetical protein
MAVSALLLATASFTSVARGEEPSRMFSVSGFGTLGVTHSTLDTADFASTAFEPNGAGYSRKYDFASDSKVGVQVQGQFTNQLSAVVQVVSEHRYDNSFRPSIEWANLRYAFTPDFSVRIGRIELPTFLNSDYRDVGYANPWARVPQEVYSAQPITNSDGADASYRFHLGTAINTIRATYGVSSFHISPGNLKVTGRGIFGIFDTLEYGALTARAGYLRGNATLSTLPAESTAVYTLALAYDPGHWFVQGELARVTVDQLTPGYLSGYVTAGYRIHSFTPYVTFAREQSLGHATVAPNYNLGQTDGSVGVRWDFAKNLDLKLQYDHLWLPSNSAGSFVNIQPSYRLGSGTNVFSAVLDFVF